MKRTLAISAANLATRQAHGSRHNVKRSVLSGLWCACILLPGLSRPVSAQQAGLPQEQIARIETAFLRYASPAVPGCALGVSRRDTIVLERGWGSANLEHGVPITPGTIFEAGSVTKQFTAAAVIRLAQQGKLSLDDDVRKHIPELPVYDAPITLRHLIHHTSGLRDWGTVMSIAGWPRGTRTYTQAHVLDIVARQRGLNYPVGTEYLYSNSNYNLLAMIAERVSGKSLADFTRSELFAPLGMTSTGWRDDYTRIVRGRAQAYGGRGTEWRLDMPFENVYGNSSLLTTVGDLLRWSANTGHVRVGGTEFVQMQERRGRLKSGREISYAGGVVVGTFNGTRTISHTGATAGYRAFLGRYPDSGFAIALLCNAGDADPSALGNHVAGVLMPRSIRVAASLRETVGVALSPVQLSRLAGRYRHARSNEPLVLAAAGGQLTMADNVPLVAISDRHFTTRSGSTHFMFEPARNGSKGRVLTWTLETDTSEYIPVAPQLPKIERGGYAGTYLSAEADATVTMEVSADTLIMVMRPALRAPLTPTFADGFTVRGSFVRFTRDGAGKVDGLLVSSGRARGVRFDKVGSPRPIRQ